MSETQAAAADTKAKAETQRTKVKLEDGREVEFAGTRKTSKEILLDAEGNATGVRFDFINAKTRTLMFSDVPVKTLGYSAGHGIAQKAGDEYSGVKEVDDMVLAVEEIFDRLRKGAWEAEGRAAGDSIAGASLVIRAIIEAQAARGKTMTTEAVKAYLQKKLDDAKAKGEKLTRQGLYASFRAANTPTGAIIKRLEEERAAKSVQVDATSLLDDMADTAPAAVETAAA